MKLKNKKLARRLRVHQRIRKVLEGTASVPRLSVYKSNKCIYAQLVDDERGHTLLATSSRILKGSGVNIERARSVGADIAEKALSKGIETALFDRSGYLYHGRIRALAEAAREKGLKL